MLSTIKLLGVTITNETEKKVSEYVLEALESTKKKLFIVTPNPEILVYSQNDLAYKTKLNSADVSLPDGVGVLLGARLLGKPLKERIPGVEFIEKLCEKSKEKPVSMGFLGGRSGVAELTAERLKKKYPWINVVFVGEEWRERKIDILFVAFGFPKQEEWIYENLPNLPVKAAMGVGGAFDYISGSVPRAPRFV
ncbi:MAG TPA: WecB/TagA/CpsF family glycosyltransferase, partial [Methylomirabilota bacterium]|nr:WecB/TagA/CpsF family glycosyltransferase [Methylomirabilota bacterium]